METVEERLARLEVKIDIVIAQTAEWRNSLKSLEGRVWGLALIAITSLLGLLASLLSQLR